jgi:Sulfotransferase family
MVHIDTPVREALDPTALMVAAAKEAGLDDYGDDRFVEALTRWLGAVVDEADLSPMGVIGTQEHVKRILVNRLRVQDDVSRHPEILSEDVSDPVVIIGFPRTGTTKLQRLMCSDPGTQGVPLWRILNPAPFPGSEGGRADPRIAVAEEYVDIIEQHFPDLLVGHPFGAESPEEDSFLLELTFQSFVNRFRARVPGYASWWLAQPRRDPYEYLHTLLQYLQWQDEGRRGRFFVLKTPPSTGNLDVLKDVFPGATVVHCHRDPRVAIASTARISESFRRLTTEHIDLEELGKEVLQYWSAEMARNLAQREERPDLAIVDVQFAEIVQDPLGVIRSVYQKHGRSLSADAESRITKLQAENRHLKTHDYSLERYGLTEQQVEQEFAQYMERFAKSWERY